MGVVGADVDQLRMLARTLGQAADRLEGMGGSVTSMLGATRWFGPDAERHRSDWHGASLAQVRTVATALREAAAAVSRNAEEQAQASAATGVAGVGGGGLGPSGLLSGVTPWSDIPGAMVDIRDFLNSNAAWPITWGTMLGPLDKLGVVPLLDALGLASDSSLSDEQRIVQAQNSMTDLAGSVLKQGGGPIGYLSGAAVTQWGDVVAQAAQADFSASTLQTTVDYVTKDPGGAFEAARDAVIGYVPKLFSNLLP